MVVLAKSLTRVASLFLAAGVAVQMLSLAVWGNADQVRSREQTAEKTGAAPASGPLRIHPTNPRYFTDGTGKVVFLTGSHTWNSLQDYS